MSQNSWIREIWPHEAEDFTPWLKDNLGLVSKVTGLELYAPEREVPAAGGRADLVVWEARSKKKVVIENQLEPANTRHWHQLVAYADDLDARIRIWVASDFDRKFQKLVSEANRKGAAKTEGAIYYLLKIDRKNEDNDQIFFSLELEPTPTQLEIVLYTEDDIAENNKLVEEFWNQWEWGEERRERVSRFKIGDVDVVIDRAVSIDRAKIAVSAWVFRGVHQTRDRGVVDIYSKKLNEDFSQVNMKKWQYDEVNRNILKIKKKINLSEIDSWEEIREWFSATEAKIRPRAPDPEEEEQQKREEERRKAKRRGHLYPLVIKSILDQRRERKSAVRAGYKRDILAWAARLISRWDKRR